MGGTVGLGLVGGVPAITASKGADAVQGLIPKIPEMPGQAPIPNAPELDAGAQGQRDEAARLERERRLASGRASTILTGGLGDTSTPNLASKVLLGS
jgi:hypothetical protein